MRRVPFGLLGCLALGLALAACRLEARPFLEQVPGARLLRDLSHQALDTWSNVVDGAAEYLAGEQSTLAQCAGCTKDPDTNRNVSQIIRSRGFVAEEHDVITADGYILTIQRIVNPLLNLTSGHKPKAVILQHGLMSSSVDWVINSPNVRPAAYPRATGSGAAAATEEVLGDSQAEPNALGFYLANEGYDVYLANSRGNIYGQRHKRLSSWEPKFWDFTYDEQIKFDLPAVIEFAQRMSNRTKVGYVGHSQGTVMMFGLLADQPQYADVVEPFVALAPVAYVSHTISPVKYFSVYTPVFSHINMWFATSNAAVKYLAPIVCGPKWVRRELCANLLFLSVGFNEQDLDMSRTSAYMAHMPSGTSVKNIAHYGQGVLSGRFAHFDHGILGNQVQYGRTKAPDYPLGNIRSKSIALFTAENDWLASPKDVALLKSALTVEPFKWVNLTEVAPKWNHIDFVYAKRAGHLVNTKVIKIMHHFDEQTSTQQAAEQ